ncbi:uncharacterized protein LOC122702549 [Cervus elaphus]|uniref:uncharacterized protein LOC122449328 n=1 Tax=Cervus canadensis TaxID=1574408 RepID=UPI001C9E4F2F|nr:uncharacterized protein LOC122449328 [Cervus canadensis]XP_043772065.1 uncharacterized protein LOC122702549 [Cervus elaphus]
MAKVEPVADRCCSRSSGDIYRGSGSQNFWSKRLNRVQRPLVPLAPRVRGIRGDPAPAPRARGPSHPVGFLRADVGGSKQLPVPYKAVRAASAGRPCRVRSGARASQRAQAPGAELPPVPAGPQPAAARQDHGCPFQAAREEDALASCPARRALGSSRGRARSSLTLQAQAEGDPAALAAVLDTLTVGRNNCQDPEAQTGSRLPQRRARAAKGEAQDHRGRSETARDSLEAWVPVRTRAAPFSLCARWAGHGSPADAAWRPEAASRRPRELPDLAKARPPRLGSGLGTIRPSKRSPLEELGNSGL